MDGSPPRTPGPVDHAAGVESTSYAQLLMANNRLEPALAESRVALQLEPLNASRYSATAYANRRLSPDRLAFVELARGRSDRALSLLQESVEARLPSAIWIGVDPRFDPLRAVPAFQDLIRQLQFTS